MTLSVWTAPQGTIKVPHPKVLIVSASLPGHPPGSLTTSCQTHLSLASKLKRGMSINHSPQREQCDCLLDRCFASHWALQYIWTTGTQTSFLFLHPRSSCTDFRSVSRSQCIPFDLSCHAGHHMRSWSVEQHTPGKSDYAVMWHHVSYLWVPEGAYTGNVSLGSDANDEMEFTSSVTLSKITSAK